MLGRGAVTRHYLPLGVAAPGVNISRGGERQSVLSSDGDVLDVYPGQRRNLLRSIVVPGSTFW